MDLKCIKLTTIDQRGIPVLLTSFLLLAISASSDGVTMETGSCEPNEACYPGQSVINDLDQSITGRVILKSMTEYTNQSKMYNENEQKYPHMIVMVQNEADIQTAVLFARTWGLRVSVRSSGHSFVGRSTCQDCYLINLSEMDGYELDLSTNRNQHGVLKVQTGLNWAEIYKMLDPVKRVIVGGSSHTVTSGGYTLGGGHSPISRSYGYAVDNMLEARVVLADGSIATCTDQTTVIDHVNGTQQEVNNGDLYWALRGGGGGTFGIVVYFIFKLHPMPDQMVLLTTDVRLVNDTLHLNLKREFLLSLFRVLKNLPREWGGYWFVDNHPGVISKDDLPGLQADVMYRGTLSLFMNKLGAWDGTEETVFKDLIDFGKNYSIFLTFSNKTSFWDYEQIVPEAPSLDVYIFGTLLQPEQLDEDWITWLDDYFFPEDEQSYLKCTGVTLGGGTGDASLSSTPLNPGYRTAITSLICGVRLQDIYDPYHIGIQKGDTISLSLRKFGKGMYFNEPTKNNPYWKEDSWGIENYNRLMEIKRAYDPDNIFMCHHCVVWTQTDSQTSSTGRVLYLQWLLIVGAILSLVLQ